MLFWKKRDPELPASAQARMEAIVAEHLQDADEPTQRLVTAVSGLLAVVAYADRHYDPSERAHIAETLDQIHGLSAAGAETILALLDGELAVLASAGDQVYTRDLRELASREMRLEVLDLLVDLAAADGRISTEETNLLRRATTAMGLEADDYVASQARHRDRLSVLNPDDA